MKRFLTLSLLLLLPALPGMAGSSAGAAPAEDAPRPLRTVVVPDYYPYSFANEKGDPDGFSLELARAVATAVGTTLSVAKAPWAEARAALESGAVDFLVQVAYSPERDRVFDFTAPHTVANDAIFVRKGSPRPRSLEDLRGKTVFVRKRDFAHDYLVASGLSKTMNLVPVGTLPEALRRLDAGEGDAALLVRLPGIWFVRNQKGSLLDPAPTVVGSYARRYCFAVREGNQELVERLNQGLGVVRANGQYREIRDRWFSSLDPPGIPYATVWTYTLVFLGVAGALALGQLAWSLSLRRSVAARTRALRDEMAEREQAEQARRESAQYARGLLEASIDPLVTISEDGKIMDVNQASAEVTGIPREDLVGTDFSDCFTDPEEARRGYQRAWREGTVRDYPLSIRHVSGRVTHVLYNAALYRDTSGRVRGIFAAARDVTDRKRAEEERSALLEQTRKDSETKARLLKEINHRVKNNLVALLGILLTEKRRVPPEGLPWVEESTGRVSARIRAMLTAHDLLSSVAWAPVSLAELADRVLRQSLQAGQSAGAVSLEVAPSEVSVSPRQATHVAIVLNELATNTLKHAASVSDRVRVGVRIGEDGEYWTLEYRDDGPGYPGPVLGGELPSVGLGLVSSLVSNSLQGGVAFSNDGGAVATLRIRKEDLSTT